MTIYEILSIVAWFGAIILILLFPKLENKFLGFMTRNQPDECDKTVQTSELPVDTSENITANDLLHYGDILADWVSFDEKERVTIFRYKSAPFDDSVFFYMLKQDCDGFGELTLLCGGKYEERSIFQIVQTSEP